MPDAGQSAFQKKLAEIKRQGEERDAQRLATKAGLSYVDLTKIPVSVDALKLVPEVDAKDARAAAVELKLHEVALVASDPQSPKVKKIIKDLEAKKFTVKLFVASYAGLEQVWHLYRFVPEKIKEITGKVEIENKEFESFIAKLKNIQTVHKELGGVDFDSFPTSKLLEVIIAGALANDASDIHLEAEEKHARLRYRLDGLLHDVIDTLPLNNFVSLISRIKLLSGLKINIRGEPQDGRFTIGLTGKEIEVRTSIIPSEFGETVVMRLLDPDAIAISLSDLGLRSDDLTLVERELSKPNGLILNTGPTGSGKTTTLYAFLKKVLNPEIKIITIEDPIEYRVEGIEQTQVDPEAGYTFATGLRAILRQDPDVILVGEIRDKETADIAMQASLTGHLVFSTLHTNDAVGAVPRLVDLGVRPATIGPALSLVIAQRLVRRLCLKCRTRAAPSPELERKIKRFFEQLPERVERAPYKKYQVYESGGCDACNHFGYQGRVGIFEFLEAGLEFEKIVLKEPSEVALRRLAEKQGMVTLQEDGVLKVLQGVTTFDEVEKVTGPIPWE